MPVTSNAHVIDATQANFEVEALNASLQQPVLVDFWAAWCGPCKQLGPILEKLAGEYAGAFRLVKVDTDKEMTLAQLFGVRSLPTVMLIKDGQPVDGFMGALPERGVREFLARHGIQPGAATAEEGAPVADLPLETPTEAIARLQQALAREPDKAELKLELAQAFMRAGNAKAAAAELDALPANLASDDRATVLRSRLDLAHALEGAPDAATLRARIAADKNDYAARDLLAVHRLVDGDSAGALDDLLALLADARGWNEGQAKKRLLAAFQVIDDAELVARTRRRMASLLF
jgi:putative thioredoxin